MRVGKPEDICRLEREEGLTQEKSRIEVRGRDQLKCKRAEDIQGFMSGNHTVSRRIHTKSRAIGYK